MLKAYNRTQAPNLGNNKIKIGLQCDIIVIGIVHSLWDMLPQVTAQAFFQTVCSKAFSNDWVVDGVIY